LAAQHRIIIVQYLSFYLTHKLPLSLSNVNAYSQRAILTHFDNIQH